MAAPAAGASPLGEIKDADARLAEVSKNIEATYRAREARVAASLYLIREYNKRNPEPISVEFIDREIGLLLRELGVDPDPSALDLARSRAALIEQGKKEESEKAYGSALSAIQKKAEESGRLMAERDHIRSDLTAKLAQKDAQLQRNQRENQQKLDALSAEIEKIQSDYRHSLQQWAARILVGVGIAGIIGTGVLVWLTYSTGGMAVIKKALLAWIGSLLILGSGFIVSQPWFLWAAGGALILFIAGVVILLWRAKQSDITLKKTVQSIEEQHVDSPAMAADLKEGYQDVNLDGPQKKVIDQAKARIDTSYMIERAKIAAAPNPA